MHKPQATLPPLRRLRVITYRVALDVPLQLVIKVSNLLRKRRKELDPSLAADDLRTGWHFSFFGLPNLPEMLLAGPERPFWTWYARRGMWDPSALAEEDIEIGRAHV